MSARIGLWLLAPAMLSASAAYAQGARPRAAQRQEEIQLRREEAFKMVDAYLVSNLQEGLGLTDEQFAKVLPLVRRLQAARRDYFLSRGRQMRELRRLLERGGATEAEVVERLTALKALEVDGPAHVREEMAALDATLSPLQQAKYRLLEGEVEQRMRELVRMRGPAAGRRPRD